MSPQTPLPKTPITKEELIRTNVAMLVLASGFVVSRAAVHISKRKAFELPDFFMYLAFALYVALWSCYYVVIPPLFRVYAVVDHEVEPYRHMMDDTALMLRLITAAQMCFYTMLLSVKTSLLTLYRKLLTGMPTVYLKIWCGIVAFCGLSWLGSVFSSLFTCDDLNEKFSKGKCGGTHNENQRIIISLYFAYAVDVTTDLAIMILPIHLTWNLQIPRTQKIGVLVLFGSGFVCIAFATLRVIQLGVDGRGRTTTPEPKWMLLWTVLECSMAIIIGCSPAFAVFIRRHLTSSKKSSYNERGDIKRSSSEDMKMKTIGSATIRSKRDDLYTFWDDTNCSQEGLAANAGRIVVRTTLHQYDERFCGAFTAREGL